MFSRTKTFSVKSLSAAALLSVAALTANTSSFADDSIDIFDVARSGDTAAVASFTANGGNLNSVNSSGYTPFILATYYGHTDTAAAMLQAGADACALDDKGSNAFMGVAFKGHLETARWLSENTDCDVNHRNYAGQTALMMAALFDRTDIAELLLSHGADARIRDYSGNSAESLAAGQGLGKMLSILKFHFDAETASPSDTL